MSETDFVSGQDRVVDFVDLINFENDYEILNEYPFTIRKKSNHYIVKENDRGNGYIRVRLNSKDYSKHRLIALQFLPNDDPLHKTEVDHINHQRDDNRLSNLRWVSRSKNTKNKTSYNGVQCNYVDDISEESLIVDFYDTKYERHEFEGYYYHDGVFYYDNDINYRILNINTSKGGTKFVRMCDIYGRKVSVYINRFLKQHDLL